MKKFLIAEAEKERILGMHYDAMGKELVNEAQGTDGWVSKSYSQTPTPFKKTGRFVVPEIVVAKNPGEDKTIVIPQGTEFKLTTSKNFLTGVGYSVTPAFTSKKFDINKANNDINYLTATFDKLKSQKQAYPINIAIANGTGGIIYDGGNIPLRLSNSKVVQAIMGLS
jgi:hypothetical protein